MPHFDLQESFSTMPRTVVTGGAGFLGSHLCEALLDRGHEVIALDNLSTGSVENIEHLTTDRFQFIKKDVTDYLFIKGSVDYILHFASPASPVDYLERPIPTLKVGSLGTHKALGLAKEKKARLLLASTSEIYGDPMVHPQQESYWGNVNPIGPRGVYDEAKRFAEAMTMAYHRSHGVDTRIVRIFNTYGPRMRLSDGRVVPNFVGQALRHEALTVYGEGKQTRSFCYVSDLVDGIYRLLLSNENEPVNIGNPAELTIYDFAAVINELTGNPAGIRFEPLPVDDPKQRQPDIGPVGGLLDELLVGVLRLLGGLDVDDRGVLLLLLEGGAPFLVLAAALGLGNGGEGLLDRFHLGLHGVFRLRDGVLGDFLEGGEAEADLGPAVLAQGDHALVDAHGVDVVGGGALEDEFLDGFGDFQDLEDPETSLVAGVVAVVAASPLVEGDLLHLVAGDAELLEFLVGGEVGSLAVGTDGPEESLANDGFEGGGEQEGLDAHVHEAGDGRGGGVGVQGAEHHVAGEGGLDGDLGGFHVADFTDEDHVGILAEDTAEAGGEGESHLCVDVDLDDAGELELDRVFGGDELGARIEDFLQGGV
jgi:dTDP-glucose 4,6-dehydratase